MNTLAHLLLLGWIPLGVLLFFRFSPGRAVSMLLVSGWLFLPVMGFSLPGLPDFDKNWVVALAPLFGVLLFDSRRLTAFRPSWVDVPMLVWCLVSLPTSLNNGLGLHDGFSNCLTRTVIWGVPYFLGRLYLGDLARLRAFTVTLLVGGLAYVPLCLFEIRMSPQAHRLVYGQHSQRFASQRFGGWRPTVFMENGLELGMWMTTAALVGIWLWRSRSVRTVARNRIGPAVFLLVVTTVLCKSLGALCLLVAGLACLECARILRSSLPIAALLLVPITYMATRSTGTWSGEPVVSLTAEHVSPDRARSFAFRLENEDLLAEKAWERPVFGWGGWGRGRVYDESGKNLVVTDGLWMIVFGRNGLVGLASFAGILLLPAFLLVVRGRGALWARPEWAPAAAVAVVLILHLVDNLLNAMFPVLFVFAAGGLHTLCSRRAPARRPAPAKTRAQRGLRDSMRPSSAD